MQKKPNKKKKTHTDKNSLVKDGKKNKEKKKGKVALQTTFIVESDV